MTARAKTNTVYVLGSGASLKELTEAEKRYLEGQTTVAMNKYLLFWEKLGVFPTHFFLADIHHPSLKVFEESVAIAQKGPRPVHFFLADEFRRRYGINPVKRLVNAPFRLRHYFKHGFLYSPEVTAEPVTYFKRCQTWDAPEVWGKTLNDLMYFYRGSLTVLLNLLAVLKLGRSIKLLGVDLGSAASFFQEEIAQRPDLFDDYMKMTAAPERKHMTAETFKGMPGIQTKWPFIRENLEKEGISLYCCNPKSLLVEEGLCPYAPVMEE